MMPGERPEGGAIATPEGRVAALVASSAAFLELKDTNALAVALPILAAEFGVRPLSASLLITSYIVILSVFIPLSGWTADRFGARPVFQVALAVFIAGSMLCAMSTTFNELVAARMIQALGGSFMTPVARLILVRSFPREELVTLMAWFGIPMMLGPLLSPLIGGVFASYASWTWIFWMNLPLGIAILILSFKFIPSPSKLAPTRIDWKGCALLMIGLCAVMVGLESIGSQATHLAAGAAILASGGGFLVAYAVRSSDRADAPLDLKLLGLPSFRLTMIGTLFFSVATAILPFLVPILLQTVYRYDALTTGFIAVAGVCGGLTGRLCVGRLAGTLTPVRFMVSTVVLTGASAMSLAFIDANAHLVLFLLALATCGFFGSMHATGLNAMAYSEVNDDKVGAATSFAGTIQQFSMALGVAFAAILVELMAHGSGAGLTRMDFAIAFILSGALCALAAVVYPRIPQVAADKLSAQHR